MNKKIMTLTAVAFAATCAMARPAVHFGGYGHRPPPSPYSHSYYGHHHNRDFWGRGGRNFWPGFVGGLVGAVTYGAYSDYYRPVVIRESAPVIVHEPAPVIIREPAPVVVRQPITTIQRVWVEGRYVEQAQGNGSVIRVWQPGHYEERTITTN